MIVNYVAFLVVHSLLLLLYGLLRILLLFDVVVFHLEWAVEHRSQSLEVAMVIQGLQVLIFLAQHFLQGENFIADLGFFVCFTLLAQIFYQFGFGLLSQVQLC
jgi:hypothetical protein